MILAVLPATKYVKLLIRSIATTLLPGLSPETMKAAHELLESSRTIGKVVVATR